VKNDFYSILSFQLGDSEERMKAMMAVKDLINASNIQGFTIVKTFLKKYPC